MLLEPSENFIHTVKISKVSELSKPPDRSIEIGKKIFITAIVVVLMKHLMSLKYFKVHIPKSTIEKPSLGLVNNR